MSDRRRAKPMHYCWLAAGGTIESAGRSERLRPSVRPSGPVISLRCQKCITCVGEVRSPVSVSMMDLPHEIIAHTHTPAQRTLVGTVSGRTSTGYDSRCRRRCAAVLTGPVPAHRRSATKPSRAERAPF